MRAGGVEAEALAAGISIVHGPPGAVESRPAPGPALVGSNAPAAIHELDGEGVVVRGWVADLDSLYATARVALAPLRFGALRRVRRCAASNRDTYPASFGET